MAADDFGVTALDLSSFAPWFIRVDFERGQWCHWPRSVPRG